MVPGGIREELVLRELGAQIPEGVRVAVIGSTSFWHSDTDRTCSGIGEGLANLDGLVLLTGGVSGVGESIGRAFATSCRTLGRSARVIHVLPRGCSAWDYGKTVFAGENMRERREILGRGAGDGARGCRCGGPWRGARPCRALGWSCRGSLSTRRAATFCRRRVLGHTSPFGSDTRNGRQSGDEDR
jgi:hypothetical protein